MHHKKGPKTDLNNYRGVCFLPLASRVIARVYATRQRTWAEKAEVLVENQCGFRRGRSTADSTQIILKVNEEVRRVYRKVIGDENRSGATLLDITKVYPRVNRRLLWMVLEKPWTY